MASEVEQYLRAAAIKRGMDPDVVVRVARSEGGLKDPFRRGMGPAPKSQRFSGTEHSFGPLQLYISGNGAGLGDRALAAGIDPRTNWQGGIDFALDEASQRGWGQWYGAAKSGISNWDGIRGSKPVGVTLASSPSRVFGPDGPKGQEAYAPPLGPPRMIADHPIADVQPTTVADASSPGFFDKGKGIMDTFKQDGFFKGMEALGKNAGVAKGMGILGSAMGGGDSEAMREAATITPSSALASIEAGDTTRMANSQQLMNQLLAAKRKRPGLSLMG